MGRNKSVPEKVKQPMSTASPPGMGIDGFEGAEKEQNPAWISSIHIYSLYF
jgi:hypothetical protein